VLYDHLQGINNNIDKPGGFSVYGLVKSKLNDIVSKCILIAPHVICTALITAEKDDITGEIFFLPSVIGSMKDDIGAWFDAVCYTEVDKKPTTGEKVYKLVTVGERRQRAKIRVPSSIANYIDAVEVPDFRILSKKIEDKNNNKK
jgi:hypothetical protein